MFTRRARSRQDVVTTAEGPAVGSSGSRGILARAPQFRTNAPTRGFSASDCMCSAILLQMELLDDELVMFVGRSAIARDLRVRADDRHVVAPTLYL